MCTGIKVDREAVQSQTTEHTTVSYCFCILPKDVARAEISNDAWSKKTLSLNIEVYPPSTLLTRGAVIKATKKPVLKRHA
jgi:hypothetical protein